MVASPLSASFKLFPSSARMERLVSSYLTMQKYGNVIGCRFAVLLSKLVAVSIRWTVRVKTNKILIFIEHEIISCNATGLSLPNSSILCKFHYQNCLWMEAHTEARLTDTACVDLIRVWGGTEHSRHRAGLSFDIQYLHLDAPNTAALFRLMVLDRGGRPPRTTLEAGSGLSVRGAADK